MSTDEARRAGGTSGTSRGTAAVEFRGIRRSYGATHALAGLDLALRPGELLALLGPSGCGKTTALRLLAGFDRPTAGQVLIGGRDVTDVPASRRDTGMVFQAYSLFPTMTAAENVAFGLRHAQGRGAERRRRAAELLELVGLGDRGGSYPHQLSGGQQQRVALARALAVSPSVLLLDEPLSALDARVRVQLRDEIRRLQLAEGITTLFVTHDQSEALAIADRVAVLNAGPPGAGRAAAGGVRLARQRLRGRVRRGGEPAHGRAGRSGTGTGARGDGRAGRRRGSRLRDRPARGAHRRRGTARASPERS